MRNYAKAVVAALVAGLGALQVGMDDGLTAQEGVGSAIAFLVGLGAVWATPNGTTVTTSTVTKPGEPTATIRSETE